MASRPLSRAFGRATLLVRERCDQQGRSRSRRKTSRGPVDCNPCPLRRFLGSSSGTPLRQTRSDLRRSASRGLGKEGEQQLCRSKSASRLCTLAHRGGYGMGSDNSSGSRRSHACANSFQSSLPPIIVPTHELASALNSGVSTLHRSFSQPMPLK